METTTWYYAHEGSVRGPVSYAQLVQWLGEGRLRQDVLIWREGFDGWARACDVRESELLELGPFAQQAASSAPAPPALPPNLPAVRPTGLSFGRLYLRSAFVWALLTLLGATLIALERHRPIWVVALNYLGSLVGILVLFAPATALVLMALRAVWRRL